VNVAIVFQNGNFEDSTTSSLIKNRIRKVVMGHISEHLATKSSHSHIITKIVSSILRTDDRFLKIKLNNDNHTKHVFANLCHNIVFYRSNTILKSADINAHVIGAW
jgi:hypothetical protein